MSKRMTRRDLLRYATLGGSAALLAACQPKIVEVEKIVRETVEVEKEVIKEVTKEVVKKETVIVKERVEVKVRDTELPFKYLPLGLPNDGKAITLSYWNYSTTEEKFWPKWFDTYSQAYPNVTFDIENVPYTKIWTKLKVAIPAGEAPDFFYVHQDGAHWSIVMGGLLQAFPDEIFPPLDMKKTFPLLDSWAGPEGKTYWIPLGAMQGCLYYNLDMFEEAGLSVDDVPKTWDQVMEVAKVLTKRDAAGRVEQAGFDTNGFWATSPFFYQQGTFFWDKGYPYQCYNQPGMYKTLQWLWDINHKHKVCDDDFLNWQDAFSAGKSGMNIAWNWFTQWMRLNHPDVNFGCAPTATWTGEFPPATGMGSPDPQSPGVPITTPPDRAQVCFDVIAWLYSRPDFLIDLSIQKLTPPAVPALADHPLLKSDPALGPLLPAADWAIMGRGGAPLAGGEFGKYAGEDALLASGGDIEGGIQKGHEAAKKVTLEYIEEVGRENFYCFEHNYQHADLMKYPNCKY